MKTFLYLFIILFIVFGKSQCLSLIALNGENNPSTTGAPQVQERTYVKSTKTVNGVTYEYIFENGGETLHVYGKLPSDFDYEKEMSQFRVSLGIVPSASQFSRSKTDTNTNTATGGANIQPKSKGLFESFTDYFGGSEFVRHMRHYYNDMGRDDLEEQIRRAKEERANIEDDLSKILTQQLILKKRQADLGLYIEDAMKKPPSQRNPTIEDLVLTEDDRLMLLENRLKRIRDKLLKQKEEIDTFLRLHGEGNALSSVTTTPSIPQHTEHHVFTQHFSTATMNSEQNQKKTS
jgi:hypothetical protein